MKIRYLCFIAVAGCVAPEPNWEKPGASQAAVDEAIQQCRTEARLAQQQHVGTPRPHSSGSPYGDRQDARDAEDAQRLQKCMTGKGYSVRS
jgi:hypothetical protein